jgi:phosphoglycolate phosphatase
MQDIRLLIFDWEGTLMLPTRELFPGVREMLLQLKQNYLLAIATNRYRRSLDKLLLEFQLENIFSATRCADESGPKPDPQMLLDILDELNVAPSQALMVGDSESDMAMAKSIGVPRIAVISDANDKAIFMSYDPLTCLLTINELINLL